MKKQLSLFTLLLSVVFGANAQKADTASFLVHYKFSHTRDTTNRAAPYTENMVLFLGKNASAYKSYDGMLQNQLFKKEMQTQMNENPGNIKVQRRSTASGTEYYQFPNDKKLVRRERLINSYLITDELPAIDWKIISDTASFGGLHCQKATAHFKGRDYTAWFCPDLPFHSGPWKLNGLPGAILEAYDAKNEVIFKFDGIEKAIVSPQKESSNISDQALQNGHGKMVMIGMDDLNADPNIIELPSGAIKTTEKEFADLRQAMRKDPNAFAQSLMAASGANMPANGGPKPMIKIQVAPAPVINNPIELPEKK